MKRHRQKLWKAAQKTQERKAMSKIISKKEQVEQDRKHRIEVERIERFIQGREKDERKKEIRERREREKLLEVINGFEDDEVEDKAIQCSICLTYKINVHWSCGHGYCYKCTRQLFLSHPNCPICLRRPTLLLNTFT